MANPRDAELNIVGHDRTAAATRSAGNNIDGLKRKVEGFEASTGKSTANVAKKFGALSTALRSGGGTLAAVVAIRLAITALPAIASLAAGGIVLALGGGLAALGLMFAAKNKEIQKAFGDTFKYISAQLQKISKPFEPVLAHLASLIRQTFDVFRPALAESFRKMAPAVDRMFTAMATAVQLLAPTIGPVTDAFIALLDAIGPQLPGITMSLAAGITAVANSIKSNPQTFAQLITFLSKTVTLTLKVIATLSSLANWFQSHANAAKVIIAGSIGPLTAALTAQILVIRRVAPAIAGMVAAGVSRLAAFASGARARLADAANAVTGGVNRIKGALASIRDRAFRVIPHIPNISGPIEAIKRKLSELRDKVVNVIIRVPDISGAISRAKSLLGSLPGFSASNSWAFAGGNGVYRTQAPAPVVNVAGPNVNVTSYLDVDGFRSLIRSEVRSAIAENSRVERVGRR